MSRAHKTAADRPQQNRVDPFSILHSVPDRGLFTGNRGRLHDLETGEIIHQRWASTSWVICDLDARESDQTTPRPASSWTPLFFLDEAVGLAAGHRPCHGCRKERAAAFRHAIDIPRVRDLNTTINTEMKQYLRAHAPLSRPVCAPSDLPDGAFFSNAAQAYLKWQGAAYPFGFGGYGAPQTLPESGLRLTPLATCRALDNGYRPVLHPSLNSQPE